MKTKITLIAVFLLLISLAVLTGCAAPEEVPASQEEVETLLIAAEQQKWDQFAAGGMDLDLSLYADDFINIGYYPTGILRQTKAEAFAPPSDPSMVPPPMVGMIDLSDFIVVHANDGSAIVSYRVTAPFATMYVSSAWALRDGKWQTVFYQASPLPSPSNAEVSSPAGLYVGDRSDGKQDTLLLYPNGIYTADRLSTGEFGVTGTHEINENQITFTDDEGTDVPVCSGDERSFTYQVALNGGTLTLTKIDDACTERLAFLQRSWEK